MVSVWVYLWPVRPRGCSKVSASLLGSSNVDHPYSTTNEALLLFLCITSRGCRIQVVNFLLSLSSDLSVSVSTSSSGWRTWPGWFSGWSQTPAQTPPFSAPLWWPADAISCQSWRGWGQWPVLPIRWLEGARVGSGPAAVGREGPEAGARGGAASRLEITNNLSHNN